MKKLTLGLLGMVQLMAQNALYVDLSGEWRKSADDDVRYAQPGFDDSAWERVQLPWTKSTYGIFWLRRVVELPP